MHIARMHHRALGESDLRLVLAAALKYPPQGSSERLLFARSR